MTVTFVLENMYLEQCRIDISTGVRIVIVLMLTCCMHGKCMIYGYLLLNITIKHYFSILCDYLLQIITYCFRDIHPSRDINH